MVRISKCAQHHIWSEALTCGAWPHSRQHKIFICYVYSIVCEIYVNIFLLFLFTVSSQAAW
jgi:hypothetical protein